MKKLDCIFVVFGKFIEKDLSNIQTINTKVIPNKGDVITFGNRRFEVINRVIDYSQVYGYNRDSKERGGEGIYIFVKEM